MRLPVAGVFCCALLFVTSAFAGPAGRSPDGWPAGAAPPYVVLAPADEDHPRAVLLQGGRFRTDAGAPAAVAERVRAALPEALRGAPIEAPGWVLVQFDVAVTPAARLETLARHGAVVDGYIPQNTLLARIGAGVASVLDREPGVVWIGRFHPAFKLSPLIGAPREGDEPVSREAPGPWRLDLRPAPDADLDALAAAVRAAGAALVEAAPNVVRVEATDVATILALARLDDVLYVEDTVDAVLLNDSSRGICQGGGSGLETVHAQGVRGGNQIVAIMDSGIDTRHCCFDNAGKIVDNRAWGGTLGALCNGDHGTHVSGTVACDNAGNHDGLAPAAKIILQDIQKGDTFACLFGSVSPPNPLSGAWSDARTRGARVHTNSWGGGGNSYGSSARDIDNFMWSNQDFLILYAAGNSGSSPGSLGSYSNAKNSVTVGGVVNGTGLENMYGSSSRGPAGDGRLLPDLTAPAQGVSSALNNKSAASCSWTTYSGTSMATPAVAGSAALVREYFERGFYPTGAAVAGNALQPTAALVKAILLASTRNMTGSGTGGARPNPNQGFGRLTLDDALWFTGNPAGQRLEILDDRSASTGFSTAGAEQTFTLQLKAGGPVKVLLAWTDAPGTVGAARALVNDLDLVVTTPDGRSFAGNAGFVDGWTVTPSATADRLNNKEAVFLQSSTPGPVTVKVRAASLGNVAAHPQDFALVALAPVDPTCTAAAAPAVGQLTERIAGTGVRSTWTGTGASSYTVYRGTTPDFLTSNPAPHRTGVQDEDPGTAGVQWTDAGAAQGTASYYYVVFAANSCGELTP